jgi:hypothetical protein
MQWFAEVTDTQGSDRAQVTCGPLLKTARGVFVERSKAMTTFGTGDTSLVVTAWMSGFDVLTGEHHQTAHDQCR